jgi:cbb3-type cytochrome oxidase cytochrome c subunit
MSECKATWFRPCKFEARYERQIPSQVPQIERIKNITIEEMFGIDVYIRDVCVRCGKTIERNS